MALKEYEIVVDGPGFWDVYYIKAKDLKTAKLKAKAKAVKVFSKSIKTYEDRSY